MADKKGGGSSDKAMGIGIAIIFLMVVGYAIWHFKGAEIRDAIRWWRYYEMEVLSRVLPADYTVAYKGQEVPWRDGFRDAPAWDKKALTLDHLSYFTALTMQPLKWVYITILGCLGLWCIFFGPKTHYRSRLDLNGLIYRQAPNFPVIAPFVEFNPAEQPPRAPGSPVPADLPPFAEALSPEEWLAWSHIPAPDGKVDEAALEAAFARQLGARWRGPDALPDHMKILLAAFALKGARKRAESDALLGRLAQCWRKGKLNLGRDRKLLREARAILRDKDIGGKTIAQANRHAFVTTAMLRALAYARSEGGVLAPAQFVWLRAHDRALWYPLNNLGRHSFHAEAMGAMAHFKAERITQRPILSPKVSDAVSTIRQHMASPQARPKPLLDYGKNKGKGVKMAR